MPRSRTYTGGCGGARLRTYIGLLGTYRRNRSFAEHDYEQVFRQAKSAFEQYGEIPLEEARVLEIGCGQRYSATLLFHSLGVHIVGIDYDVINTRTSWRGLRAAVSANGIERTLKSLVRRAIFDRRYYALLERKLGRPLVFDGLNLRSMDACALRFDGEVFDYAFSNAAFEHIYDAEKAVAELARVLRPGGVAYVAIHLFPSLSGGHHLEWAVPDERPSTRVPPWDHLRASAHPSDVYLNKLRERDYLAAFERNFSLVDASSRYEGHQLLTQEIRGELRDYSESDLLKRTLILVARKSGQCQDSPPEASNTDALAPR